MMPGVIVLADPLTQSWELPVSPLFVSAVSLCVLGLVTWAASRAAGAPAPPDEQDDVAVAETDVAVTETDVAVTETEVAVTETEVAVTETEVAEGPVFWLGRAAGLALLVLAVVAGRFGSEAELSNIAPALVMGAGWPLLVLAGAAFGNVWERLNPFDTLARLVAPLGAGDGTDAHANQAWAIPAAALWVAYLTMWPNHLAPRSISNAVLIYTVFTLAGVLAFGRRTWLAGGEVFTVFFGLIARVRRHGPAASLPQGAHLVLAVLCGGFVYGLLRDSQLLINIGYGPRSTLYSALALVASVAVTLALTVAAYRGAQRRNVAAAIVIALVPAATALAVALALARNRFTTSLQLLPVLSSDPLGRGADLLGTRDWVLNARLLGIVGLLAAQVVIVLLGCLAGAVLAARRARGTARTALASPFGVLAVLLAVAVAAIAATALTS